MTLRIGVALESWQYLDNHNPQRFDFCIGCKSTDKTCQLYYHQVKIMIINGGANILVSGVFLKRFSIQCITIDRRKRRCRPAIVLSYSLHDHSSCFTIDVHLNVSVSES